MTDPNVQRETVVHNTTVNAPERRSSGGGFMAFAIVGILVVLAIVAFALMRGGAFEPRDTNVDVKVEAPELPDVNLPEPKLPNVDPPRVPGTGA